jgi:hypothetical protein
VDCTVSDASHNSSSASFTVTVSDTTPPVVVVPASITVEATSPAGATVTYSATAHDIVDGPVTPTCSVVSGATFAIGQTLVSCTASDAHHNNGNATFAVNVVDTSAPVLSVPAQVSADATSPAGAVVAFSAVATDAAGNAVTVSCAPPSGAVFPIGNTTVQCTATDSRGNASAAKTFVVHVRGADEQLAAVVAQVARWNLKGGGLLERLQAATKALAKSAARACGALGELTGEPGDSADKRLTAAQRSWLGAALTRIVLVLGCAPERGDGKGRGDEGRRDRE